MEISTHAQELPEGAELEQRGSSDPVPPGAPDTVVFHVASNRDEKVGEACSSKLVEQLDRTGNLPFVGGISWTLQDAEPAQRQDGFSMFPSMPEEA